MGSTLIVQIDQIDRRQFVPALVVLAAITYGYLLGAEQLPLIGAGKSMPATAVLQEGVPTGSILMTLTTCPISFVEVTALNGKTLMGTLAANSNVGGTGGADAITPAGTNSGGAVSAHAGTAVSVHSGTAVASHADHTHTYTQVPNHVHPYASQTATTGAASSYEHGAIDTSSAATEASITTNNPTGGVATGTTNGVSASLTHNVTQPSDHSVTQPSAHTFTQPTFTGTQFDNRSAFTRIIFCEKT